MKLQINAAAAALVALNMHKDAEELAPLSAEGALLAFDFTAFDSLEAIRESISAMDNFLAGVIADADEAAEIAALTALKREVVGVERTVVREYAYKTRATENAEATAPNAESQLHVNSHTDINGSSISDGADETTETDEEVSGYGTQEEQSESERKPRRRRS